MSQGDPISLMCRNCGHEESSHLPDGCHYEYHTHDTEGIEVYDVNLMELFSININELEEIAKLLR
jgi:hypothetical protein